MPKKKKKKQKKRRLVARKQGQCGRKIGYLGTKQANAARRSLEDRGETGLHVYQCPHCGKFHVGHK